MQTVYEILEFPRNHADIISNNITIHDPCGVRFEKNIQQSIRKLVKRQGFEIREMKHNCTTTFCCGEGGSAGFIRPDFSKNWTAKRVEETGGREMISYCAGCTHFLGSAVPTHHILDLCFFPGDVMEGKHKVSKAPFTYWNRFRLKYTLQKKVNGGVSGSRAQLII